MTDDKTIFERAAERLAPPELGRQVGDDFHLTVVGPTGTTVRYELVGVDGACLR